jgi:hypothetical protein
LLNPGSKMVRNVKNELVLQIFYFELL